MNMGTLPEYFNELLSSIEPDEERSRHAQDIPTQTREFLKGCEQVETVTPHTRLVGSYARQTAIDDIKDVDIILFVSDDYRQDAVEVVLKAVFSALHGLPKFLDDTGEVTVRRRQRRSVNITFDKADFSLDVVPAIAPRGITQPLEIPDREWSKWVKTHPLGYGEELTRLNKANGSKVIPLIKMFKFWRDVHMAYRRPKSYWLESLVYQHISSGAVATERKAYADLFRDLLGAILDEYSDCLDTKEVPAIPDPMLGHNVAHNWEYDDFEAFMERVRQSYSWTRRALDKDDDHVQDAIDLWVNVFGNEKFPTSATDLEGRQLHRAIVNESVYTTRTLGRVYTKPPSEPSVNVPPQRFYGEADE